MGLFTTLDAVGLASACMAMRLRSLRPRRGEAGGGVEAADTAWNERGSGGGGGGGGPHAELSVSVVKSYWMGAVGGGDAWRACVAQSRREARGQPVRGGELPVGRTVTTAWGCVSVQHPRA